MTANQIRFAEHKETQRHNRATEKLGTDTLSETSRHNVVTEGIGWGNLAELQRHNYVGESINWYAAQNTGALQGSQAQYVDTQNAGYSQELSNRTTQAEASQTQAEASQSQASTAQYNAVTKRGQAFSQEVGDWVDRITGWFSPFTWIGK